MVSIMEHYRIRVWSNEECFEHTEKGIISKRGCWISPSRLKFNEHGSIIDTHNEQIRIDQFTGLFDAKNRPIFINDYIAYDWYEENDKICFDDKYTVIWHNNSICAMSSYHTTKPIGKVSYAIIVGNISET
jgi:hypothetical protein